ncbi:hypothetical protein DYB32_003355 [Aphanomyces invadans]|uniref:Uncharacterized protein n=1 Tax=Aphanomyces invadans TaxID=157072 RepID=A0A418B186_9STRA|nr:hypothetical protein DYB32_003355 [Aphanomyces invadans]
MGKLPFPTKDLFSNQSPQYRQKELDKFVSQLQQVFQSLSMVAQVAFFELLEVPQHDFHRDSIDPTEPTQLDDTAQDDGIEKRVSKQSISSTTTTEIDDDNQHETLSDASPSEHHHTDLLSPVASSRSASSRHASPSMSPRHDSSSKAKPVDLTPTFAGDEGSSAAEAVDIQVSDNVHGGESHLDKATDVARSAVDELSEAKVLDVAVESTGFETQPQCENTSLLFQAVEAYSTVVSERSPRAWETAGSRKRPVSAHQCRYLITRTMRVLYPSLFI